MALKWKLCVKKADRIKMSFMWNNMKQNFSGQYVKIDLLIMAENAEGTE